MPHDERYKHSHTLENLLLANLKQLNVSYRSFKCARMHTQALRVLDES